MKNNPNIEDVTNSPEDWEDFWNSPSDDIVVNMDGGVGGSWKVNPPPVSNYVDDVLSGKNIICKRESPLSE